MVKFLFHKHPQPEMSPGSLCKSGRKDSTPQSCPLTNAPALRLMLLSYHKKIHTDITMILYRYQEATEIAHPCALQSY